ncbi:MAG: M24 family metallopeptidase [Phycisphaerae bacterium]
MARKRQSRRGTDFAKRRRWAFKAAGGKSDSTPDALLVTSYVDVTWLTGFTGADSYLLTNGDWAVLLTDGRYTEQAANECGDVDIHKRDGSMAKAVTAVLDQRGVKKLAIQAEHLTVRWRDILVEHLGANSLHPITGELRKLRAVKDQPEVAIIRRAIEVAETSLRKLMDGGKKAFVGRTERQVAAELDYLMRVEGAEKSSFDTIVAAGPHGSLPHYRPGDYEIQAGEPVLIDWGAKVNGYCSDLTRVVFTGRIPPKIAELYDVVVRSQEAGMAAIRAGVAGSTPDKAARKQMAQAGLEEKYLHGLGHGIGLEIHELPVMGRQVKTRLKKGMVVTVEPGLYEPGTGGVRIEDDVLVTADGFVKLSTLPTDPAAYVIK